MAWTEYSSMSNWPSAVSINGGFPNGRVLVQQGNGLPTGSIHLRQVGTTTNIDTYTLSDEFPDAHAFDNQSNLYMITASNPISAAARKTKKFIVSNNSFTVVETGTFNMPAGATSVEKAMLNYDTILLSYNGNSSISAILTYTGETTIRRSLDPQVGHNQTLAANMGNYYAIVRCSIHGAYEQWKLNTTSTVLSGSVSIPTSEWPPILIPLSTDKCFIGYTTDDGMLNVGMLNTSPSLGYAWGPTKYPINFDSALGITATARGYQVAILPWNKASAPQPWYIIDMGTQTLTEQPVTSYLSLGSYNGHISNETFWCGEDYLTFNNYDYNLINTFKRIRSAATPVTPLPFAWSTEF